MQTPPLFCFCGPSNSGKTTFLCRLIRRLKRNKIKVGVLKSCHHPLRDGSDTTDTDKLMAAGADRVLAIVSGSSDTAHKTAMNDMDIVLVEGGRSLGEKVFLLPGWRRDLDWRPPKTIHRDLEKSTDPFEEVFYDLLAAIRQ